MNIKHEIYENTAANAKKIGWLKLPDFCIGDVSLPYVLHDRKHGVFKFGTARDASIWEMTNAVMVKTKKVA